MKIKWDFDIVRVVDKPDSFRYLFLLMAFSFCFNYGYTQKIHNFKAPNVLIESRANVGFLVAHHLEMEVFNKHIPSFEISLAKATYGKQQWEALYLYPVIGVTYWSGHLGSAETLGKAHAIMPYISFPLTKNRNNELDLKVSAGLGYLTQKFDRLENYKYIAIGSHVNAAVNFMVEYRWKPTSFLQLSAGMQLMHFSNGSIKTPNFGLNIPSLSAGVAFRLNKENPYIMRSIRPSLTMYEFDGHDFLEGRVSFSFGTKSIGEVISERYNVMTGSMAVLKSLSYKSKAGLCFDILYDGSDVRLIDEEGEKTETGSNLTKSGVSLMYELVVSRLSFPFGLGFYTGGRSNEGISYYKIGMQYLVTPNVFGAITLKTHFARADYVTFGVGYRFKMKYNLKKL